jgi:hypothetical protein
MTNILRRNHLWLLAGLLALLLATPSALAAYPFIFVNSGNDFGSGEAFDVSLGDVDGDGDLDVVTANWNGQPEEVWLNQGGAQGGTPGSYGTSAFDTFGDGLSAAIPLGDLDGDGDLDVFVANQLEIDQVWLNQGGAQGGTPGNFGSAPFYSFAEYFTIDARLGDLDGDGDLDVLRLARGAGNQQQVWLN